MKLLFVVSSLDLTQPFSATPAWWQLMKGLYEIGVEVIAAPYQGAAIESPWWRAAPNPARLHGEVFRSGRDLVRRLAPARAASQPLPAADSERLSDRLTRRAAQTAIAPLWLRHLDGLLRREPDIDALIFLTVPLNHLSGVPAELIRRHNKPIFYYDGDVPASLPDRQGFATGFRIYDGADPGEYTAFLSNSAGGVDALLRLGARAAHVLFYGADPDLFSPVAVAAQDIDVFFYGHTREYRERWLDALLAEPSRAMPDVRFAARGKALGDLGQTAMLPYLSMAKLREYASRSRLNLCITREAHAGVFASSSSRPFELASMGCCIVANPYNGIETWFEPGKELFVVESGEAAVDLYRYLLAHDAEREAAGRAARERLLREHTYRHRAQTLVEIVRRYL